MTRAQCPECFKLWTQDQCPIVSLAGRGAPPGCVWLTYGCPDCGVEVVDVEKS